MALQETERQWFAAQNRRATSAHDMGQAQNAYDRRVSNGQQSWRTQDLRQAHVLQREQFARPWNRKGMMNSGMYQNALVRLNDRQNTETNRNTTSAGWRTEGFDLAGNQLSQVRDDTLQELRDQQTAYQRQVSAMLQQYGS